MARGAQIQNLVISLHSSATQVSSHWEQVHLVNKVLVLLTKQNSINKKPPTLPSSGIHPRCWADLFNSQSRKAPRRAVQLCVSYFQHAAVAALGILPPCHAHVHTSCCLHAPLEAIWLRVLGNDAERMFF